MTTTYPPRRRTALARDRVIRFAELATTPLLPADYLDLFAPLRSGAPLRGRIEEIHAETADAATTFPQCFQPGGWGGNTAAWSSATPGRTGSTAEQLALSGYSSGDAKLLPTLDLQTCARPNIVALKPYRCARE